MKYIFLVTGLMAMLSLSAQERGNAMYGYNNNYNTYDQHQPGSVVNYNYYLVNDSVYALGSRVMINLLPDSYMAVFAIHQEGATVAECNKLMGARITQFKAKLKAAGVKDEDIFVDMVAQTRIYDYKIDSKVATQTNDGFELKKNIVIGFTRHALLEDMMLMAAEHDIYDLVKVDYIINDMDKVKEQLRTAAMEIIESKRKFVLANSSLQLKDKGIIQYENFSTVFPAEGYRKYVAVETATVQRQSYNNDLWVKEQRKSQTFYFEKLNPSAFDKVINPAMVRIPMQVCIDISEKFYLDKPDRKRK